MWLRLMGHVIKNPLRHSGLGTSSKGVKVQDFSCKQLYVPAVCLQLHLIHRTKAPKLFRRRNNTHNPEVVAEGSTTATRSPKLHELRVRQKKESHGAQAKLGDRRHGDVMKDRP